ncbi:hypothetical protein LTR62_001569 [Meristemomyces frigidus]|uniref:Nucleoporin n=1 Tax=Meristemomyces frigidus TaxID=1508187 RepID=A0AAN7TG89_9PEZI|nr:hypothetical protein LTR62_001569 [Meristemomyces frigidus]
MATQSSYFPPLDKCLASSSSPIVPWTAAYKLLCDLPTALRSQALETFFDTPEALRCLLSPLAPFASPSSSSKSAFETKTAPIHVSQANEGQWDLDVVKKDALWLSDNVGIEEVAALRLAIGEVMGRSAEDVLVAKHGQRLSIDEEGVRHERMLAAYLEERQAILAISAELITRHVTAKGQATFRETWLTELAAKVMDGQRRQDRSALMQTVIDGLRQGLEVMHDHTTAPTIFFQDRQRLEIFLAATLQRMIDLMRLLQAHLHSLDVLPDYEIVLSWIGVMNDYDFMQTLRPGPILPNVELAQCLCSLTSLTMLKLPLAVARVAELTGVTAGVQYPTLPGSAGYLDNKEAVQGLSHLLYEAAQAGLTVAAPTIYAWALISKLVRDAASSGHERREVAEQNHFAETGSMPPDLPNEPIEERWEWITSSDLNFARDDSIRYGATAAVDGMSVYNIISMLSTFTTASYAGELDYGTALLARTTLYDLVSQSVDLINYDIPLLESFLAVMMPAQSEENSARFVSLPTRFLTGSGQRTRTAILDQALARYPYEISPLLRLCTVLAFTTTDAKSARSHIVDVLDNMETVTVQTPQHFSSYHLENEDEGTNRMVLDDDLTLFAPRPKQSFYGEQRLLMNREIEYASNEGPRNVLLVPAGSQGFIIREKHPMVMCLKHPHSGLEYFGLVLASFTPDAEVLPVHLGTTEVDKGTAVEIIRLINAVLSAALRHDSGSEEAIFVLGRLSYALHENSDITLVISQLFELELQAFVALEAEPASSELCVVCLEYYTLLINVAPERVWSLLARSGFLSVASTGGAAALATVAEASTSAFLASCGKLYHACFNDAVRGLVKRRDHPKAKSAGKGSRFDSASPVTGQASVPERSIRNVLEMFTKCMLEALQLNEHEPSYDEDEDLVLRETLCTFDEILRYTHGLQSTSGQTLSAPLLAAVQVVLEALVMPGGNGTNAFLETLVACLADVSVTENSRLPVAQQELLLKRTVMISNFLATVLRTLRLLDPTQACRLANQLVMHTPTLAAVFVVDTRWRLELAGLLKELCLSLACTDADPTSLLTGLSQETAKAFLTVVKQFDGPVQDLHTSCAVWKFLNAALEGRQQLIGIFLLTGAMPRSSRDKAVDATGRPSSTLLTHALNQLANIEQLPPPLTKVMLSFIATAQRLWPWATLTVRSHPNFLTKTLDWLNGVVPPSVRGSRGDDEVSTNEHQAAAYLCDILAAGLHAGLETGDTSLLKILAPRLSFLSTYGCNVDTFNRSLHNNLAENLNRKFSGMQLEQLRRSAANEAEHGGAFAYDLEFADRVLAYSTLAWEGIDDLGPHQGFKSEVVRANVNLSLLDAQKSLLSSWARLAGTLADWVGIEESVQDPLIVAVQKAVLNANAQAGAQGDDPVGAAPDVLQVRAEMVFVVLSKLVGARSTRAGMKEILTGQVLKKNDRITGQEAGVWDLVRNAPVDYDVATAQEDLAYYRTLLQILFLALKAYAYMPVAKLDDGRYATLPADVSSILIEIITKTIAPGFRALCGNLHTDVELALPGDFALNTALLQAVLSVKGFGIAQVQVAEAVANSSLMRSALSLYSWADQLADQYSPGADPIYGEVAISTLVRLSSIPPIAEQMAAQGVLASVASANLSQYFRKAGGKGVWDSPARMFTIWTEGILPLCLNLLEAVGPALAGEIAAFLNGFSEQLGRAETAFQTGDRRNPHSGDVTLGLVREAHSLILISLTLQSDLTLAAKEGISAADMPSLLYEVQNVKVELEGLVRGQRSLRDRIVPANAREEALRVVTNKADYDNELQRVVVEEVQSALRCFGDVV